MSDSLSQSALPFGESANDAALPGLIRLAAKGSVERKKGKGQSASSDAAPFEEVARSVVDASASARPQKILRGKYSRFTVTGRSRHSGAEGGVYAAVSCDGVIGHGSDAPSSALFGQIDFFIQTRANRALFLGLLQE